jgi:hypothetical protein
MRRSVISLWVGLLAVLILPAPGQALPASAPDPAVLAWKNWPFEASCYAVFDPVAVFSRPATAERGSAPAQVGLRQVFSAQSFPPLPPNRWRAVTETEKEAVFVHGSLDAPFGPIWVRLEREGEGWEWSGSGTCSPSTTVHGLGAVTWSLSAGQRLGPQTRRLRVHLGPGPCSSGMSQNKRARKPIFRQLGRRLVMIILLEPLPPGFYTCQGVSEPPLTVRLPSRLGSRKLFDGGSFPPRRAEEVPPALRR